jgi:arylsulfatase
MKEGHLRYGLNYVARHVFEVASPDPVPAGSRKVRFEFEPTGEPDFAQGKGAPGRFQLYVDGELVAETDVPYTTPTFYEIEGLSCGYDLGAPVLKEIYQPPFAFTGTIHSVTVDLSGEVITDPEAEMARVMAQQ